jgi:antitoxin ChpS
MMTKFNVLRKKMTNSHGGERIGAGRKKIADRRITIRLDPQSEEVLREFDLDRSPTDAFRHCLEFHNHAQVHELLADSVLARFVPTKADETFSIRLKAVYGEGPVWLYPSGLGGKTVKARIPLGDGMSAWVSIPNIRVTPPSIAERANEEKRIAETVTRTVGIPAQWVDLPPPKYTLDDLLAQSDYSQPQPASAREWIDAPAVGNELL